MTPRPPTRPARRALLLAGLAGTGLAAGLAALWLVLRPPAVPTPGAGGDGAALFAAHCAVCHGPTGRGDGPGAGVVLQRLRNFSDPAAMRSLQDGYLFAIIQKGGSQFGRSNAMPAWGMKLGDDQIHALVRHIRSLSRAPSSADAPRKDAP